MVVLRKLRSVILEPPILLKLYHFCKHEEHAPLGPNLALKDLEKLFILK